MTVFWVGLMSLRNKYNSANNHIQPTYSSLALLMVG
jgi:hypothetical protein